MPHPSHGQLAPVYLAQIWTSMKLGGVPTGIYVEVKVGAIAVS
jgi:hypothetical protein